MRATPSREVHRRKVGRPCEGKNRLAVGARDLRQDVRGRAEAVEADDFRILGFPIAAKTDQPGTKQRRRLGVAVALGDRQAEALLGDQVLGIAAVEMTAGEARSFAEVFLPAPAVLARTASPT